MNLYHTTGFCALERSRVPNRGSNGSTVKYNFSKPGQRVSETQRYLWLLAAQAAAGPAFCGAAFVIDESSTTVWEFFEQFDQVARCVPGVEEVTVVDADNSRVRVTDRKSVV